MPHLVYELHLTNLKATDVVLTRVEIRDADRGRRQADYRGPDLARRLGRPGARPDLPDRRLVAGGMRAVVHVWLAVDGDAVPARLQHRIELDRIGPAGRQHAVIDGIATRVLGERPGVLDPPLRGGPWVAVYDPLLMGGHRTTIYTMGGKARIPARYAIDWIKLGADGSRARGDESRVASWHGHGAEVLAVADAVVADARDDVPGADSIGASKGPIGQPWRPAARPTGGPRSRELPAPNVVVRFGPERP